MGGLKDAGKIVGAGLAEMFGDKTQISTINAANMLSYTGDANLGIAKDIWDENINVEYRELKDDNGLYTHSTNTITLSSSLIGGGKEESAKLATVMAHEGSHANGVNVEALAHANGLQTYSAINTMFGLNGDKNFSNQMLAGIMAPENWKENTGDVEHWRIVKNSNGKITEVKDDGDNSLLTVVDENGSIQDIKINDNTSLTKQISELSKTGQTSDEINTIMMNSGLDYDKEGKKGWYAKTTDGQYKVGQNIPEAQNIQRKIEVTLSEDRKSIEDIRDITVFQEEIEKELNLPHTACAIASVMLQTDSFLLENYGIGAKDSQQMIEILKSYGTSAFETSGNEAGKVKNMTALSAFYAQGLGMDDYLIFDTNYTSQIQSKYYVEKAFYKNSTGIDFNRAHFMTNTIFGYYDPDKNTNNRWWTIDTSHQSVYRKATPKSSRIKK